MTPKPYPRKLATTHYRIRFDKVTKDGKLTLGHAGKLHQLGIGARWARTPALMLIDNNTVTVLHQDTGEILSTNTINEHTNYWRNNEREPGRWPGSQT
ncbi:hypothetical protein [Haematomicrobium sanguinis]|uniref:hypothetical protein n=1 Tax=Haematomicrobium sanguinis TaxID=479106 RepID=UPI000691551C|nr:hypothetical protein [Haematomicrobium sanguinis]